MPHYKLTYFDARYRPEVSRLLFKLANVEFEDVREDFETWSTKKKTSNAPLGALPILEIDSNILLCQSRAIQRYLAKEFGYYGKTNLEQARIDVVTECYDEFLDQVSLFIFGENLPEPAKAGMKKKFVEETAPRILSYLEKLLQNSTSGYFVGDSITLADVAIFNCIDVVGDWLGKELFAKYTKLLALKDKVAKQEKIAPYLAKRPKMEY